MADILYTYCNQVYANITNKCDCNCRFCIRSHGDSVGDAETLWHKQDPSLDEIKKAMDDFDFTGFQELVYCGYGEPTCALENLIASAKYAKEKYGLSIRLNTNGLANLYFGRDIVPEAFDALLAFASECKKNIPHVKLTVVDVLSKEDIEASQKLADELGITLRVRQYS